MDGLTLLDRARAAGLAVESDGDRLIVRGPRHAEAIARELIECKAEVLTALAAPVAPTWEELNRQRWGPSLEHDPPPIVPDPLDRLRGPCRTVWGTLCWSDPDAPEIDAFGPPPTMPPPPPPPTPPPPVPPTGDDAVVHKAEIIDVMCKDGKIFFVSPHLSDDPERPSKVNVIIDVNDEPIRVNPQ